MKFFRFITPVSLLVYGQFRGGAFGYVVRLLANIFTLTVGHACFPLPYHHCCVANLQKYEVEMYMYVSI